MGHNGLNPGQRRDTRRQRLYDAEDVLADLRVSRAARKHLVDTIRHPHVLTKPSEPGGKRQHLVYPSIEAVQAYVDHLTDSAWWQRRWGGRRIIVAAAQGRTSNSRGGYEIRMSAEQRHTEAVILHEIAHCLTDLPAAHHGPEFAGILLTLVRHVMGAKYGDLLRDSYREHGVRYTMANVPTPSEDKREVGLACTRRRLAAKR